LSVYFKVFCKNREIVLPDEAFVAAVHFAATIGALKMACLHMLHARSAYYTHIFAVLLRGTTYEQLNKKQATYKILSADVL